MIQSDRFSPRSLVESAIIASLYVIVTWIFAPIGFGGVQIRISEALYATILFTPSGIWGVSLGCLIANILFSPFGLLDITLGTLATFIGAVFVYLLRERQNLAFLGPVLSNAFLVALVLHWAGGLPYWMNVLYVGAGEAIAIYCIGSLCARFLSRFYPKSS